MRLKLVLSTAAFVAAITVLAAKAQTPGVGVFSPKAASATCAFVMRECAEEVTVDTGEACLEAAAVDEDGGGAVEGEINAECVEALYDAGEVCLEAVEVCGTTSTRRQRGFVRTAFVGQKIGTYSEQYCQEDLLVSEIIVSTAVINGWKQVSRIELVCSDGNTLVFGKNFGTETESIGCGRGYMIAGLTISSDSIYPNSSRSRIMGMKAGCEKFSTGVVYPSYGYFGGEDNVGFVGTRTGKIDANHTIYQEFYKCPTGRQLAGLGVSRDNSGYTYLQGVRGMLLICK